MRNLIKENRAITIGALVVTIIIILILSSVAISLITGKDGLFSMTYQAGEDYTNSTRNEFMQMTEYHDKIDEIINYNKDGIITNDEYKYLKSKLIEWDNKRNVENLQLVFAKKTTGTEYRKGSYTLNFALEENKVYYIECYYIFTGGNSPIDALSLKGNANNLVFSQDLTVLGTYGPFIKIKTGSATNSSVKMTTGQSNNGNTFLGHFCFYAYSAECSKNASISIDYEMIDNIINNDNIEVTREIYNNLVSLMNNEEKMLKIEDFQLAFNKKTSGSETRKTSYALSFSLEKEKVYYIDCYYFFAGGNTPYNPQTATATINNLSFSTDITVLGEIGGLIKIKTGTSDSSKVTIATGTTASTGYQGHLYFYVYE